MAVEVSPPQHLPYRSSARFVVVQATFLVAVENGDFSHRHETPEMAAARLIDTTIREATSEGDITVDAAVYRTRFVHHSGERAVIFADVASGDETGLSQTNPE
jgi:hypothetical protein